MINLKKIFILYLCTVMVFTFVPALGAEQVNTFLSENFNSDITGDMPVGAFKTQKAGGAEMGVVEFPDAKNKSVYLRGVDGGAASLTGVISNPDALPITLSFRFLLSSDRNTFSARISDSRGISNIVMNISDNMIYAGDRKIKELEKRRWYMAALTFDLDQQTYRIAIDGETFMERFTIDCKNIDTLSLELSGNESAMYIDDISAKKADVGGEKREVWPTKMWVSDAQQLVVDDILLGNFTMFHGSTVAYKNGVRLQMPARVEEINAVLFVPLRFSAEQLGAEVVWNEVESAVYMMYLGKTIKVSAGSGSAYTDGAETALIHEIKSINGTTYISALDLGALLNYQVNSENGYIMFGPDWDYYKNSNATVRNELVRMVKYQRPDGETMYNALVQNNPNKDHPRILGRVEDFAKLKALYEGKSDDFANKAFASIIKKADRYCGEDVTKYVTPVLGTRQHSNGTMRNMITTLGMAYKITGDKKYAERAVKEIMNVTTVWPELGEKNALDLGDNGDLIALAYDWFYNEFTAEQKATIRQAVLEKIFPILMACYRGDLSVYPDFIKRSWVYQNDNENSNLNKGAIMLCLALGDDYDNATIENYIKPILKYSVLSIEYFIDNWYPDGAWHEGPGYGTAVILQMALQLSSIETACGTDFGFYSVPGIMESGIWALYMEGATGAFNYSDSWEQSDYHQSFFWLSRILDENIFTSKRAAELIDTAFSTLWGFEMIWYESERFQQYIPPESPDKYFRVLESTVMRSGWDKNDWYVGFHAGENGIAHSQFDTGSLVLDWAGTRWIKDLGVDDATYSTLHQKGEYYRQRAEGHNTIVIDDTPYKGWDANEWPVIFEDDFENEDLAKDPSKWKISESSTDPNGQGELGVVNVEYSEKDGNKKNKAMYFEQKYDKETGWSTGYYAQRTFGPISNLYPQKGVEISFKYKIEKADNPYDAEWASYYIEFNSPATEAAAAVTNNGIVIRKYKNSDAYTMSVLDGKSEKYRKATFEIGKWHDLKFYLNFEQQTMDVWFDGTNVGSGLKFANPMTGITFVRFGRKANGNIASCVDDFVVRVDPREGDFAKISTRLQDQSLKSQSPITAYESKPKGAYAVTDMIGAYRTWASKARRGVKLINNRNAFVVRDEFTLLNKSDFYWFAHSAKNNVSYEISADGKSAILKGLSGGSETGSRLWAGIISNTPNAKFEVMECIPMNGSPTPSNQADNSVFHKLAVKLTGVKGDVNLAVAFVPLEAGQTAPDNIPEDAPLDSWSIPDGEIPKLDTLTLNGVQIENFEPTKTTYNISLTEDATIPVIGAVYKGQILEVSQPQSLYDTATFSLMDGGEVIEYKVGFNVKKLTYAYIQGNPITDSQITASSSTTKENGPAQIIDRNMKTNWTSKGDGEWVQLDFKKSYNFSKIEIAWLYGTGRNYKFELLYSNDGTNWEKAYEGESSGAGEDYELYDFGKTINARFLKFVGHGNNKNLYNNILEIR